MFYWDNTYLLVIVGAVICMAASASVNRTFRKYAGVRSASGLTGAQVAERVLAAQGIYDVGIEHVSGNLTDHYDPKRKTVCLSDAVYAQTSVAAIGVAAHECGHAAQHNKNYVPLTIRSGIVPIANIGSTLSWPLILAGIIFGGSSMLINLGIIFFSFAVLFQLVTLPVEFNASSRALQILKSTGILSDREAGLSKKVLSAAALTYVAAAASSILQLLRLIILFGGRSRED